MEPIGKLRNEWIVARDSRVFMYRGVLRNGERGLSVLYSKSPKYERKNRGACLFYKVSCEFLRPCETDITDAA